VSLSEIVKWTEYTNENLRIPNELYNLFTNPDLQMTLLTATHYGSNKLEGESVVLMGSFGFRLTEELDLSLTSRNKILIAQQLSTNGGKTWTEYQVRSSYWTGVFQEITKERIYPKHHETTPEYISDILPADVTLSGSEGKVKERYPEIYDAILNSGTDGNVQVRTVLYVYLQDLLVQTLVYPAVTYRDKGQTVTPLGGGIVIPTGE
jgi:hypothetical protein